MYKGLALTVNLFLGISLYNLLLLIGKIYKKNYFCWREKFL